MINASELRINNYVGCKKSNDTGIYQVSGIDGWERVFKTPKDKEIYNKSMDWQIANPKEISRWNDERLVVISGGARTDEKLRESQLKPIRITEEILIKLGFEKQPIPNFYFHKGFSVWLEEGAFTFQLSGRKIIVIYLHELQNLYYATTKFEIFFK